jgi:hypothetical protein
MTELTIPQLFHYTCEHGQTAILLDNEVLRPGPDGFLWLTDLNYPFRDALGLTSKTLSCDRTEYRFDVDMVELTPTNVMPWWALRREFDPLVVDGLESVPGVMPMHWWLAVEPLQAHFTPGGGRVRAPRVG